MRNVVIAIIMLLLGGTVRADIIRLDARDSTAFNNLDSACAKAAPGDTLQLAAGTYEFYDLRILKPLTLQGVADSPDSVVLAGNYLYCLADSIRICGVNMDFGRLQIGAGVSDVRIDSNVIRCSSVDCQSGSSVVITGNCFYPSCNAFMPMLSCRNVTPIIHNNTFTGDSACHVETAIEVSVGPDCPSMENPFHIYRNTFIDCGYGIKFEYLNSGPDSSWVDFSYNWWGSTDTVDVIQQSHSFMSDVNPTIAPILEEQPDLNDDSPGDQLSGVHYNSFIGTEIPVTIIYITTGIDDKLDASMLHTGQEHIFSLDGAPVYHNRRRRGIYLIYDGIKVRKVLAGK